MHVCVVVCVRVCVRVCVCMYYAVYWLNVISSLSCMHNIYLKPFVDCHSVLVLQHSVQILVRQLEEQHCLGKEYPIEESEKVCALAMSPGLFV